jgi:hypothetical protein
MKYRLSTQPNTQHVHCFVIRDFKGTHETRFNISKKTLDIWGKPSVDKLKQFMIAYVKKNGWAKEAVEVTPAKSPRSLSNYITSLQGKPKAAKGKA